MTGRFTGAAGAGSAYGAFLAQLEGLDGSLQQMVVNALSVQCALGPAAQGAAWQLSEEEVRLLALHPQPQSQELPAWLEHAAGLLDKVAGGSDSSVWPLPDGVLGNGDRSALLLVPLPLAEASVVEAFLIPVEGRAAERARQVLEATALLLALAEKRLGHQGNQAAVETLGRSMEILSAINRQRRFQGVAMAFCNEMAAQWGCERVSVGFLKGRYVRVKALSHTEHFSRKMRLVQDVEAVMEECLDQDTEVLYPAPEEAMYISRAAAEKAQRESPQTVLSLPLRQEGKPEAVVTLERPADRPFSPDEVEAIRLTCDLAAPRLMNLHHFDRWIGARMAARTRSALATVVGPQYTWAKLTALLVFAAVVFLVFVKGWYKVKAPFVFEAITQHKLAAPFDGFIKDVEIEVGDPVVEGRTTLAQLDTAELRLQLAAAQAERVGYLKQADAAMRDGETAEAQIAQANADKAQAQIDLLSHQIAQAQILSPVTGVLVTGDLKRQIGAPVETGQILFEVAPIEALRAELHVPEDEVFAIAVGQEGELATATYPGDRIAFTVERVNPAAEVVNNRNVFKVRVRLAETRPWMRPGMEGVAKVTIDKRPYAWIWTRKVINWIRMKLWI